MSDIPRRFNLPILHFNDVYRMTQPKPGTKDKGRFLNAQGQYETNVSFDQILQFAAKLNERRDRWETNDKGNPEGLVLFSGDLFSSSVESILTKGQNMVHIMNELAPDACVPGNHEFDFGLERFTQLVGSSNFNWILSNVKQPRPGANQILPGVKEYVVVKRAGLTIGIIGVMSLNAYKGVEALTTSGTIREPMYAHCLELSEKLRKSKKDGGKECDIIIALTHAKHSEDIKLAHRLAAYPKDKHPDLENTHGVDIILGGHNHSYYFGKGVDMEEPSGVGSDYGAGSEAGDLEPRDDLDDPKDPKKPHTDEDTLEQDRRGNPPGLLILKSGSDFYDLSEIDLIVEPTKDGSVRRKVVTSMKVKRHAIDPAAIGAAPRMNSVLQRQYDNEIDALIDQPIAFAQGIYKDNTNIMKKEETPIGNWIADVIRGSKGQLNPRADALIMTAGSFKHVILDGIVTKRQILQMIPYNNITKIIQLKGKEVLSVLEKALAVAPKESKGFPVVSGLEVHWSPKPKPESRVNQVFFLRGDQRVKEELQPETVYKIMTNDFLTGPLSPFEVFTKAEKPLEEESWEGLPMSGAILQFLDPEAKAKGEEFNGFLNEFYNVYNSLSTPELQAEWAQLKRTFLDEKTTSHVYDEKSGLIQINLSEVDGRLNDLSALDSAST